MSDSTEYDIFSERFESAMSAWKFQVDSYWTRNSYFALFETAAAAGVWKLIECKHWWTSLAFSVGLVVLTLLWLFNNRRLHEYISYWWERAGKAEEAYTQSGGISQENKPGWVFLVHKYESNRPNRNASIPYHNSIQVIPVLFLLSWVWTAGISLIDLACNCHQLCVWK